MIKSLTFNQLLTYEGERFAQSFNITIERMLFFRWCQILVPKFWIGFQYWANVWNDSTICLWKTQQEVLDSPVLECRNWRSERPIYSALQPNMFLSMYRKNLKTIYYYFPFRTVLGRPLDCGVAWCRTKPFYQDLTFFCLFDQLVNLVGIRDLNGD